MNPEIEELLDELEASPGPTLDWRGTRERIYALHAKSESFEERGFLLKIYVMLMDSVEKMKLVKEVEEFRKVRQQDYNLFLIRESTDGENIDPQKLLAACQREIAAGHMAADDEMHTLARYGDQFISPPPAKPPVTGSWWKRVFGR